MVGGQPDSRRWRDLDPFSRRRRIRDAARTVVAGAGDRGPQLIVVEDLHWIDEDTQGAVGRRRVPPVAAAARSERWSAYPKAQRFLAMGLDAPRVSPRPARA